MTIWRYHTPHNNDTFQKTTCGMLLLTSRLIVKTFNSRLIVANRSPFGLFLVSSERPKWDHSLWIRDQFLFGLKLRPRDFGWWMRPRSLSFLVSLVAPFGLVGWLVVLDLTFLLGLLFLLLVLSFIRRPRYGLVLGLTQAEETQKILTRDHRYWDQKRRLSY
jgi:hypothetical protein